MKSRIALISDHASPLADLGSVDSGGQNVYVAHVASELARLGYAVDVFTRRDNAEVAEVVAWRENIRVIHVPAGPAEFVRKENLLRHMPAFAEYLIKFIRHQAQPYDLIHANFWMSGWVAAKLKVALGIPFVITFHALGKVRRQYQGKQDDFPDQRFEIEDRLVREADGLIAECPQDEADLIHFYHADPRKIVQIPCGFDPKEFEPVPPLEARQKIGVPANEWIVLQLGRMVPRKGVDTALRGFAKLAQQPNISARMIIVGGETRNPDPELTPEIGRLQKIAEEEGVAERVSFIGKRGRDELKYYFSAADVFISTPWYEPFGLTPLESMACGTPVIGSNVGGIKFTVVDDETGYLVPPEDPDAIGDRLLDLYQNREKLKQLSEQAKQRVREFFTWERVGKQIAALYEKVLMKKASENSSRPNSPYRDEESAIVWEGFEAAVETFQRSQQEMNLAIMDAAERLIECFSQGGKVMVCGNGGSAADAQHFASELTGRFVMPDRRGLPVLCLNADTAFLTAWSNDMGYEKIFARQVEALGQAGDLLIGISTSGNSENLVEAFQVAREMNITCVAILGSDGGDLLPLADAALVVPSDNTQRIQEVQILILHLLCELIENSIATSESLPTSVFMGTLHSQKIAVENPKRRR